MALEREDVEAVALRVVELLEERQMLRLSSSLVDAQQVAETLGVSRAWVYEHADELGATRLGEGPKARLRFRLDVGSSASACHAGRGSTSPEPASLSASPRRRPRRSGTSAPLLPIRGPESR